VSATAPGLRDLSEAECWALLDRARLGLLGVVAPDGPDLFPIDFIVSERSLLFRSAPGEKLMQLRAEPRVALAAEGVDREGQWSVVVRGRARRLDADDEIEASGVLELQPAAPGEKANFVRITPSSVTGRRLPA